MTEGETGHWELDKPLIHLRKGSSSGWNPWPIASWRCAAIIKRINRAKNLAFDEFGLNITCSKGVWRQKYPDPGTNTVFETNTDIAEPLTAPGPKQK